MNTKRVKKKVLRMNPGYSIIKEYEGNLNDEQVLAFIITKEGIINRCLIVYEGGQIREPSEPMALLTIQSLHEVK